MNDGLDILAPVPAHSDLGASGMDRWSHCPGSFALGRRERHRLPTIHAATGTVAHDIVERCVQSADPIAVLASVRDTETEVDGHVVPVTDELLSGVQTMLAYVAKRFTELGEVAPLVEQTVSVDLYFPPEAPPPVPMFGRADVQFVTPGLLEIIDYKNGSGVLVNVVDHPQLLYYAAGALAAAPRGLAAPRRVRLTVVQPNARTPEKIRSYDLTALDVLMWVAETLIPAVRACEAPDPPYVPGPWCGFCPVAHACPRLLMDAQAAARTQFDDSAEGQTLADRLELAETVALWVEAVRGFALERARSGLAIPGWGAVPTRPRRVWTDPAAVARLLQAQGLDPYKTELRSPAQIEALAGKNSNAWAHVTAFIESRSGGLKIGRVAADDQPFDAIAWASWGAPGAGDDDAPWYL